MTIDNFAQKALEWDNNPQRLAMVTRFVAELQKNCTLSTNWKALEVGAGTGLIGLQLLPQLGSIVFEDTSEAMLEILKGKLTAQNNVEILHGEVQNYSQQDIDLVFSSMAFHHIIDIEAVVNHLFQITKTKAKIIISDIVTEDGSFHGFEEIPHKGFDKENLALKFKEVGFKNVKSYIYNTIVRENDAEYEQFILIAEK